jgi:hypothetical protein
MKWRSYPRNEWHAWFAWRPVHLTGTSTWVWLETVERWCDQTAVVTRQYRELSSPSRPGG